MNGGHDVKTDKELFVECAARMAPAMIEHVKKFDGYFSGGERPPSQIAESVALFANIVATEIVEKALAVYPAERPTKEDAIAAERHAETVHVLRARIAELELLYDKASRERDEHTRGREDVSLS